jgi:hypothetical protein
MDRLNAKYGRNAVRFGVARPDRRWQSKAARRSPRYTTRLAEIPLVR